MAQWMVRLLQPCMEASDSCSAYESKTIFIRISWNVFMKPRRITRQVLIKTSVASALVAVLAFIFVYTAIILATSSPETTLKEELSESSSSFRTGKLHFKGRYPIDSDYENSLKVYHSKDWGYDELVNNIEISPRCTDKNLTLIIIITSAPANIRQRNVIRNTWCSSSSHFSSEYDGHPVRKQCVFLIGGTKNTQQNTAVHLEAEEHRDILLGKYSDSYRNLTYKVISGFHWAVHTCKPKFLLKTDDDCFVNMYILTRLLTILPDEDKSRLYVGNVFMENKYLNVIRDPYNKWAVSREDYAPDFYPRYASGTGYILSNRVAEKLLRRSRTYNPFPNEDAYIGVLAEAEGVLPTHSHRFTFVTTQWKVCNFLYFLVLHHVSLEQQLEFTANVKKALVQCANQKFYTEWS